VLRNPPPTSDAPGDEDTAQNSRLEDLLQRYGALLHRIIRRVCASELGLSCDDIEQEARISLWKALGSEREIAFPVSYISKVGVSAAHRAIRRARARREQPLGEEGDETSPLRSLSVSPHASPDKLAERHEWLGKIDAALAQLPENRRLAVQLHLQDLKTTQIAQILGWTEPKARNLLYRGLKDLRKSLRAIGIDYQS
jgi:RNA polymerase sigma factor (sigma-70 family)